MQTILYGMIIILASTSYFFGIKQMLADKYSPSFFSRIVWFLLAINSFAGVVASNSSKGSIVLAGVALLGSLFMAILSHWKGTKDFGGLEYFCIAMLTISVVIWLGFDAPLINLGISLFAHFIGALPTYKKVWLNPLSESKAFWSLFFVASVLSVFVNPTAGVLALIYPIYYSFFDGGMFFLTFRKTKSKSAT